MTPDNFGNENSLLEFRWSEDKINCWYAKNNWPIGCNYIPHNSINQLEMWQSDTFDPILIDQELNWACELGFNTIRVFLHHLVWEQDPAGYLSRIDHFLSIADKYHIKTMFVLFDAVWNPFPKPGKQPDPKHYVHNSGWVQCPGYEVLNDGSKYDDLYDYVCGIVDRFKVDERVLLWDVFNEPDNNNIASYNDDNYIINKAELSMNLLRKAIGWIRRIDPIQPITMAPWQFTSGDAALLTSLDNFMFSNSDIISFHCYEDKAGIEKRIIDLKSYNRPILCTEYMARPFNSTFREILPILRKHNVGAYNWGFVAGKSQTHCPWDSWQRAYTDEPVVWFHDVLRPNGEPYDKAEVEYLIEFNRKMSA